MLTISFAPSSPQAADKHHIEPRTISFKGAVQTLEAFQPLIATQGDRDTVRTDEISTRSCSTLLLLTESPTGLIALSHDRENAGKRNTIE